MSRPKLLGGLILVIEGLPEIAPGLVETDTLGLAFDDYSGWFAIHSQPSYVYQLPIGLKVNILFNRHMGFCSKFHKRPTYISIINDQLN